MQIFLEYTMSILFLWPVWRSLRSGTQMEMFKTETLTCRICWVIHQRHLVWAKKNCHTLCWYCTRRKKFCCFKYIFYCCGALLCWSFFPPECCEECCKSDGNTILAMGFCHLKKIIQNFLKQNPNKKIIQIAIVINPRQDGVLNIVLIF